MWLYDQNNFHILLINFCTGCFNVTNNLILHVRYSWFSRHGLHIFGGEPKVMVLKRILQKNDFSSGSVAVLTLLHHMMLLMVSFENSMSRLCWDSLYHILGLLSFSTFFSLRQFSVEQGLIELRKLGIERRMWEASRKESTWTRWHSRR